MRRRQRDLADLVPPELLDEYVPDVWADRGGLAAWEDARYELHRAGRWPGSALDLHREHLAARRAMRSGVRRAAS